MIFTSVIAFLLAGVVLQLPPGTQTVPYYIADGTGTAGYDANDGDLAVFAMEAWARESGNRLKLTRASGEAEALLRLRWIAAGDGQFGEMQVLPGGKGAVVFVAPGVSSLGEPFASRAARDRLFRDTIVYL